mmetsp:Transcript_31524/g.52662  ORF Transcript_31524/g.52662 Transcript_31524/m.52662 type:complete len:603 (+) Transcript_31524:255-2063(+)
MESETAVEVVEKKEDTVVQKFSVDDLFQAVRYGAKSHISFILENSPNLVNKLDSQGFSCMHWAAKRGDEAILMQLQESGADMDIPASYDTQMLPVHWAASDAKLKSIKFFLDHRVDINAVDANNCSPLIVAAQYGRWEAVVYLIKNGADVNQRDINGDTALHWAAYKGYEDVTGLLVYMLPQFLDSPDTYGQTPLHLAALRGNDELVHYLISECHANTTLRDKNGCTALMLAVKKEQLKSEWYIRRLTSSNTLDLVTKLGISRLTKAQILVYLLIGCTEYETMVWIWRVSFWSNFIASYVTIGYISSPLMADFGSFHMVAMAVHMVWWVLFMMNWIKSPGTVTEDAAHINSNSGRVTPTSSNNGSGKKNASVGGYHPHSYSAALEIMGSDVAVEATTNPAIRMPQVCHTSHVQRPLRSKFCKVTRRNVCKFDHFCPYVYNTVGRDNYKYFLSIVVLHPIAALLFLYMSLTYWSRGPITTLFFCFLCYTALLTCGISGLASYHIKLVMKNMTTNEEINCYRYEYFRNEFNMIDNPFKKATLMGNLMDALFPSNKLYYSREEVVKDKRRAAGIGGEGMGDEGDDDEEAGHQGYFEGSKSKLLED